MEKKNSDEDTSTGTQYSSDELITEYTTYSCALCGNDVYHGTYHYDCFGSCARCGSYYACDKLKRFDKEGHLYDDERLCKTCRIEIRVEIEEEEAIPDIKEPE